MREVHARENRSKEMYIGVIYTMKRGECGKRGGHIG
jgi:hypothetical protein